MSSPLPIKSFWIAHGKWMPFACTQPMKPAIAMRPCLISEWRRKPMNSGVESVLSPSGCKAHRRVELRSERPQAGLVRDLRRRPRRLLLAVRLGCSSPWPRGPPRSCSGSRPRCPPSPPSSASRGPTHPRRLAAAASEAATWPGPVTRPAIFWEAVRGGSGELAGGTGVRRGSRRGGAR